MTEPRPPSRALAWGKAPAEDDAAGSGKRPTIQSPPSSPSRASVTRPSMSLLMLWKKPTLASSSILRMLRPTPAPSPTAKPTTTITPFLAHAQPLATSISAPTLHAIGRMRSSLDISRASVVSSLMQHQLVLKESLAVVDVKGALDPQSTFLKVWHQLLLAAIFYELFLIPFVVVFEPHATVHESPEIVVFYVCELLFLCDFGIKLNTGFYEDGSVHRDTRRSMLKYVKSFNFLLDVIAIVPMSLLEKPNSASNIYLEIHKVLRLKRVPGYLNNLDDFYAKHFEALKIFKTVASVFLLSHYIACIRYTFGYDEHHTNHWLPKRIEHGGHGEAMSIRTQYLQALFWGFGMLTGLFEGELPHGFAEFAFTIVVALCGFSVFTYLCALFFMLSKCESGQTEEAEARINQLKHIMAFHEVPERLQLRTIDYLKRYSTDADSNDREALKLLCPSIAKDLQVELLQDTVSTIPVFVGCSKEFIQALTNALEVIFLPAHCTVFRVDEEGDAMYIIHGGVLDVILGNVKVRELRKGDFVGEMSLFSNRNRSATVVTTTYCILYKLSRFHTERVLEGYPRFVPVIRESVMKLIAKADQQATAGDSTPPAEQTHGHRLSNKRRSSAFASQLSRMVNAGSNFNGSSRKKSTVVPQDTGGSTTPELRKEDGSASLRPEPVIGRLRRIVTGKRLPETGSVRMFYDQYKRQDQNAVVRTGWSRLLLKKCIDADSPIRLKWIVVLQLVLIYDWILTPLEYGFPAIDLRIWFITFLNVIVDAVLVVDIYLNFNLSYNVNSEKIVDTTRTATRYLTHDFAIDMLLAFPYWMFQSLVVSRWALRVPRLLRVWRASGHMHEIEKLYPMNSKRKLFQFGGLLLLLSHVVASLYFSITTIEGFNPGADSWIPTDDVQLIPIADGSRFITVDNVTLEASSPQAVRIASMQYFRSFYYATNILTGLGKTVQPLSDTQFVVAVVFMFSGFIITAVIVDNVQKHVTASAFEQKEFFATRSRIQLFLRRQNAPLSIHHRVNAYLDYWWSSHCGAHVEELIAELPIAYRREILRSICNPALQTLALMANVRPVLSRLETAFVDSVRFVLYGQSEVIYHEGDNAEWIYFSLHGIVSLKRGSTTLKKIPLGGFFGVEAIQNEERTTAYMESAIATSGCILIRLSRPDALKLREVFSDLPIALSQLERRLLDNKLARFASDTVSSQGANATVVPPWKSLLFDPIDPDSPGAIAWETWLFCAMTVQWITALYHMSFGVHPDEFDFVDGFNVFLEISFFIDVYVRSRVGYFEFGNKIMDVRRIRKRYFRSRNFLIDAAALIPLFTINWMMKSARYELLNINKLIRLLKVPKQFVRLEQRYLKRTTELRILKLAYYAFLATHLWGCVYHDFSSHLSTANLKDPNLSKRKTEFGWNLWLLVSPLKDADNPLKYFSSIFWAFGLMSASYQCELPKTIPQCIFSVITMTTGFFLFAYVIGNFADVIELVDGENREFNARIGSVRDLLSHFTLPETLSSKMKGYFFFRRYHTITQEHLIESSLPPSLVTDIRLLNLQPMISKVPFMSGLEPAITRMLVAQFGQVLVLKGEYVYRFGDDGTDMFFVLTGILAVKNHQAGKKSELRGHRGRRVSVSGSHLLDNEVNLKTLRETSQLVSGDFFGENALFSDSPRNAFVLAKTSCILYSLSRQSLNAVFELYPNWKKQVTQTVKIQQKQHRLRGVTNVQLRDSRSGASNRDDVDENESDDGFEVAPLPSPAWQMEIQSHRKRTMSRLWMFLKRGTQAQGPTHIRWLWVIMFCTVFNAVVGPYRIAVDALERWTGVCIAIRLIDIFCDTMFALDIWFNWHLRESSLSVELYEQNLLDRYKKERLLWDAIAAVPIDYVLSAMNLKEAMWFRLLRCIKVVNLVPYLNEINRLSVSYEITHFTTIWLQCLIYLFWVACAYLSLGVFGGFGEQWNAWAPSKEIEYHDEVDPDAHQVLLRFLRGMFYATTAFAKKAKTIYPESTGHLAFSISMSFIGTLVNGFMIGEVAGLYISSIRNQIEFRKNHITLELFLSRYKVSRPIRDRVHTYLSTLWSAHSGVDYEGVLAQLPSEMRTETIQHIAELPLDAFVETVFNPLLRGDAHATKDLLHSLATELKFVGYPRGELVIAEGVLNSSMYFVVRGQLAMTSSRLIEPAATTRFRKGQYFGEKGILSLAVSQFSVRALKACDLFSLSSTSIKRLLQSHGFLQLAFEAASEVIDGVRKLSDDPKMLDTDITVWKAATRSVLEEQRQKWVTSNGESSPSRGLTLWTSLLVDILDGESKDSGLSLFEHFLELLTTNGKIFQRPKADREGSGSRVMSAPGAPGRLKLRAMVAKLARIDAKSATSAKSSQSTKVHSTKEAKDEVVAFVADE